MNPKTATPKEGRLQPLNNNSISLAKLLNNVELSYEPNVKLTYAMIARLPTHNRAPHQPFPAPTSAHLRTILSRAVLPSSLTFRLFLLKSRPIAAHLRLPTHACTAPPLRHFAHQLTHDPPHRCALSCEYLPNQSLSELIGANQTLSEMIRYLPISSD